MASSSIMNSLFDNIPIENIFLQGTGGIIFVYTTIYKNIITWNGIWSYYHYIGFSSIVLIGLEILAAFVFIFGKLYYHCFLYNNMNNNNMNNDDDNQLLYIRKRGKHLDKLDKWPDLVYISINKLGTILFTYHLLKFCWESSNIIWSIYECNMIFNILVIYPTLFIIYDFFYTLFHRFLHHRFIYKYIHKHHHKQKAPSRGNLDAINVHPLEFFIGEYNHLFSIFLASILFSTSSNNDNNNIFHQKIHIITILLFIISGGFLASLNHTRFDIKFPLWNHIYQVKFHDIHHWYPECNYGQYLMLWDHIFQSFKSYPKDDDDNDNDDDGRKNVRKNKIL